MSDFLDQQSGELLLQQSGDELLLERVAITVPTGCNLGQEDGFTLLLEGGDHVLVESCVRSTVTSPAGVLGGGRRGPYWEPTVMDRQLLDDETILLCLM